MRNNNLVRWFWSSIFVGYSFLLCRTSYAGGIVNNGGDALVVGDTIKMFDEVECSQAFSPDLSDDPSVSDAFSRVSRQLEILEKKLPSSGRYVRSTFSSGQAFWCFVEGNLKEVDDEGETSLAISYDKEQVAVNQKSVIKIRRDIWDQMNGESRANLLLHEALWTAVGPQYLSNGAQIRQLTGLLMARSLPNFTAGNLARFIKQFIDERGRDSKLVGLVSYDIASAGGLVNYLVDEVVGDLSVDLVTTVRNKESALNGKRLTSLNPNPLYHFIWVNSERKLWTDIGRSEYSQTGNIRTNWQPINNLHDVCGRMSYGGYFGWRLPSRDELKELVGIEILQWQYAPQNFHMRAQTAEPGVASAKTLLTYFIYPSDEGLSVLAEDADVYDLKDQLRNVTPSYGRASSTEPMATLRYPNYFCIHD